MSRSDDVVPVERRTTTKEVASAICPGDPLDEGIAEVVKVLMDAGVHTMESCEGGDGHAFDLPTVKFSGGSGDGWRALAVCQDCALPVRNLERTWDMYDNQPDGPYWKLVFRPRVRSWNRNPPFEERR